MRASWSTTTSRAASAPMPPAGSRCSSAPTYTIARSPMCGHHSSTPATSATSSSCSTSGSCGCSPRTTRCSPTGTRTRPPYKTSTPSRTRQRSRSRSHRPPSGWPPASPRSRTGPAPAGAVMARSSRSTPSRATCCTTRCTTCTTYDVAKRTPEGPPPPPTVQRVRIRYTKRGRLRFTSHRDIARAFERALRRAAVPMAYSAGFSPHPKISWVGAAPTGVASEAEYVEIGLAEHRDLDQLAKALDESLPAGIDILEAVDAPAGTSLPDRIEASRWAIKLPGVHAADVQAAVEAFLRAETIPVERLMKTGMRTLDARSAVVSLRAEMGSCAILHVVV